MKILYVTMCFLAVACHRGGGSNDYASPFRQHGLPVIRRASNQRPTAANERWHPSPDASLPDYANRREKHVDPAAPEKIIPRTKRSLASETDARWRPLLDNEARRVGLTRVAREFSSPETDQRLRFPNEILRSEGHAWRSLFKRTPLATRDAAAEVVSTNSSAISSVVATSTGKASEGMGSSPETDPRLKFSSVYAVKNLAETISRVAGKSPTSRGGGNAKSEGTKSGGIAARDKSEESKVETATGEVKTDLSKNVESGGTAKSKNDPEKGVEGDEVAREPPKQAKGGDLSGENKRNTVEGVYLGMTSYGSGGKDQNRRHFEVDNPHGLHAHDGGGNLQYAALNPIRANAAAAYRNHQSSHSGGALDYGSDKAATGMSGFPRILYRLDPARINALNGVFDRPPPSSTANFRPIRPKEVAFAPPKLVYETKLAPAPFAPIADQRKAAVQALSALLGRTPEQQLQGLNLILNKGEDRIIVSQTPRDEIPVSEKPLSSGQAFVTPLAPTYSKDSDLSLSSEAEGVHAAIDRGPVVYHATSSPSDHQESLPGYETVDPHVTKNTRLGQSISGRPEHGTPWDGTSGVETPEIVHVGHEGSYESHGEGEDDYERYAGKYTFGYRVVDHESGNDFGHEETRDGDVTKGRYHVLLPDGRVQNVNYHVDHDGGYHAKVSYRLEGAHH